MAYAHAVGDRVLPTHYSGHGRCLEAMFPEHWERGTGMWNVEHRFVKSRYERGIPIPYVPIRDGTRSKCDGNDVPGTLFRNEGV